MNTNKMIMAQAKNHRSVEKAKNEDENQEITRKKTENTNKMTNKRMIMATKQAIYNILQECK